VIAARWWFVRAPLHSFRQRIADGWKTITIASPVAVAPLVGRKFRGGR
jgi:hypothetical protein